MTAAILSSTTGKRQHVQHKGKQLLMEPIEWTENRMPAHEVWSGSRIGCQLPVNSSNGAALPLCAEARRIAPWWLGDALSVGPDGLAVDGVALVDQARRLNTPLYVYGAATFRRRFGELRAALDSTGSRNRIHYAMKANRFRPLLDLVRAEGNIGIDASSPREVETALAAGFSAAEISVTASMLSNRDLAFFAQCGVHLNLDTRSVLRRWSELRPSVRSVGLRIDPGVALGWGKDPKLSYGGSKFGFAFDEVIEVAAYAATLGLEVCELHMHPGWGLQTSVADQFGELFARLADLACALPTVRTVNVGGGLGWRHREEDEPLSLDTWALLLRKHLAPTNRVIACEPGTFIAAASGVLLAEVNTVTRRSNGLWVGVDAGYNVNCYAAHYGLPHGIIRVRQPLDPPTTIMHVAGNINEANDVFARARPLPHIEEGELVAFYPAGAYGSSMASDHCMRGLPNEVLV
jgi:diaminopimelate decarboxylase